jgi:hypothetical protein
LKVGLEVNTPKHLGHLVVQADPEELLQTSMEFLMLPIGSEMVSVIMQLMVLQFDMEAGHPTSMVHPMFQTD